MSDRGGPVPDQTRAPLQVMTQEQYDGLRELAPRYEEAGVSIAEIDAQRAARATAEAYFRENAREAEKAWTRAHELEQARATAYAEGQRAAIERFAAFVESAVEDDASATQSLADVLGYARDLRDTPAPPREERS